MTDMPIDRIVNPEKELDSIYAKERLFMQGCYDRGWRYSGRPDGNVPSVAGTHEWDMAYMDAAYWECHQ